MLTPPRSTTSERAPAPASPPTLLLEDLTSPDIGEAVAGGFNTVVVPCGAVEQHGPHLPLISDTLQARALALGVAERLGNALVAPAIPVGCSDHHLGLPGTISVRASTLEALYADYCRSLARHGFRRIACLSGHGGNFAPLTEMLPRLRAAAAPAQVAVFTDIPAYVAVWAAELERRGQDGSTAGGHADRLESSIMLSLRPDLVRTERLAAGFLGNLQTAFPGILRSGVESVSPNGILGDARRPDAELGRGCLAGSIRLLAEYFASDAAWAG